MRNSHAAIFFFLVRGPDYEPWPMGLTLDRESTREGRGYLQGGGMCGLTLVTECGDSLHSQRSTRHQCQKILAKWRIKILTKSQDKPNVIDRF